MWLHGPLPVGPVVVGRGNGIVRIEDRFDTSIDDLWLALTDPRRLARSPLKPRRPRRSLYPPMHLSAAVAAYVDRDG